MMSSSPSKNPSNSAKNKESVFRKWLPAILFALLLHLVILFVFFMMQHDKTASASSRATRIAEKNDNAIKSGGQSAIATSDLTTITENDSAQKVLKTEIMDGDTTNPLLAKQTDEEIRQQSLEKKQLIEKNSLSDSLTSNHQSSRITPESQAGTSDVKSYNQPASDSTLSTPVFTSDKENEDSISTNQTASLNNKLNTINSNRQNSGDKSDMSSSSMNVNEATANTTTRQSNNPNDALLLPRDLPETTEIQANKSAQYSQASKEIEDINAKLSQTINEVKRQKMQEIEAEKQRQRDIYIQDKAKETRAQVAKVGQQLEVDKLAEAEFSSIINNQKDNQ